MVGRRGVIQTLREVRKRKDKIRKYKKKTMRVRIQTPVEERQRGGRYPLKRRLARRS